MAASRSVCVPHPALSAVSDSLNDLCSAVPQSRSCFRPSTLVTDRMLSVLAVRVISACIVKINIQFKFYKQIISFSILNLSIQTYLVTIQLLVLLADVVFK